MNNAVYLLIIVIVVLGLYSFDLKRTNASLEQTIHGHYMNNLSEASQQLQLLESEVTQSLLFNDERARQTSLQTIWRLSSNLKSSITKLPLPTNVANEWNSYIGKIGDSAKLAAEGKSTNWRKQMMQVQSNLAKLNDQWSTATAALYSKDHNYKKWTNVALDESPNSFLVQSAQSLKSYKEKDFPLTASESDYEKKRDLQNLMDEQMTKDQIVEKFKEIFPQWQRATLNVTKSHDDAPYPFYHIQFARGTKVGYADFTEKGGHLLSLLVERPFEETTQSHEQIRTAAENFLKQAGFQDVTYVEARENKNVWHLVYSRVTEPNEAIVYPDSIQLKVAKDNGDIVGINTMEYVQKEEIPKVEPVELDPASFFSDTTKVEHQRFVYTENAMKALTLCYEFIVRQESNNRVTYKVLVDSVTHEIVKVEMLP